MVNHKPSINSFELKLLYNFILLNLHSRLRLSRKNALDDPYPDAGIGLRVFVWLASRYVEDGTIAGLAGPLFVILLLHTSAFHSFLKTRYKIGAIVSMPMTRTILTRVR